MIRSDSGFYILAIHSFIEHYIRNNFAGYDDSWTITFNTNLYNYKKYLIEKNPGKFLNELSSFKLIIDQDKLIDSIRHDFVNVSIEEARAATFNFLQFCKASGIDDSLLIKMKKSLDLWDHNNAGKNDLYELETVKNELFLLKKENNQLLEQYKEFEDIKAVKKYLESRIETLSLEIELQKRNTDDKSLLIDELTLNQIELRDQKDQIESKISSYHNIDKYLKNLLRVSLYTRTRMDYERSLTQLTEEQRDILNSITLKTDFLIKGGAGTGKTLILLEAMKKANAGVLEFANKKLLLLTYTNTLVKYDRYISEIMEITDADKSINTADSYLNGIFEELLPELTIDYSILTQLCRDLNHSDFFDEKQLRLEIEDYIYGYGITKKEYLHDMISRKGMKIKLTNEQRETVWKIKKSIESNMMERGVVSKAFSRILLNEKPIAQEFDHIFIDESQDLYPIELQLLKKLAKSSLIMAGDTDQSIYGIGSPYLRADISTSGTTRILKTNFRNSIPIHDLAEQFRKKAGSAFDKIITPSAFREGPIPELYTAENTEALYDQLIDKIKIFINTIEYDRENICILAPSAKILKKIHEKLLIENISSVNIKDPDFSFKSEGSIRLSPLHSSKGLDLPVVMLFIPILFYNRELESDESETLVRNLIYVSMTRAMQNLNIFTKMNTEDPVLEDLISIMND